MEIEARSVRHLDWLAELGELAMAVARRTGKEAAADEATPAQVLSFERAARTARSSIQAEAKLAGEQADRARPDHRSTGRGWAAGRRGSARLSAMAAIKQGSWTDPALRTETDELVGVSLLDIVNQVSERAGIRPDCYGWSDEELNRTFQPMQPLEAEESATDGTATDETAADETAPEASGHDPP